ncbi:MAG: 3-hydroxyacyl-ACP dehydratase FabZ [Sterolibacterium sp.]|jgi:3-hydroxyacyl-[acyl-carrier-protein] dehydratase|nr:3-hydroxyacyl-ACP dehydratase FabZ [Sterolibacterium sp.]
MDINDILKHLPHRYPMLMIDRVLECVPGERIAALKNVSINEPYFPGHYPHQPVMPGVLIIETMAQAAAILAFKTLNDRSNDNTVYYFVGIEGARFKKPVLPGDQLKVDASIIYHKRGMWRFKAQATVEGQLVSEAELMCTLRTIE